MTTLILTGQGYTVLQANSPAEAIRLAQEHEGEIRLLITDVIMPGMNGKDLAHKLLSLQPQLKCLFMSGYTANAIDNHGVLDDGLCCIQKPFSLPDLATKVRQVGDNTSGRVSHCVFREKKHRDGQRYCSLGEWMSAEVLPEVAKLTGIVESLAGDTSLLTTRGHFSGLSANRHKNDAGGSTSSCAGRSIKGVLPYLMQVCDVIKLSPHDNRCFLASCGGHEGNDASPKVLDSDGIRLYGLHCPMRVSFRNPPPRPRSTVIIMALLASRTG